MSSMDRSAEARPAPAARPHANARPAGSWRFDLWTAVLSAWFVAGMFLDGWAHNNGRVDNTFFTPWHMVLYSGFTAVGLLLVGAHFRNVNKTRVMPGCERCPTAICQPWRAW